MSSTVSGKQRTLPEFQNPPVIETVLGVEFAPLQGWSIPHFGLLWNEFKEEYPLFEVQPALPRSSNDLEVGLGAQTTPNLQLAALLSSRCWFFNEDRTSLVQVQSDRFLHNWIKSSAADEYPRYENIRPMFEREWDLFRNFLSTQKVPLPTSVRCEVTYVNHIERGENWHTFGDLTDLLKVSLGGEKLDFLPLPDQVICNARYPMTDALGTLTITFEPAIRKTDQKEVLQLRLTAQGGAESARSEDIVKWLDKGREWIVRGFTDFTTPRAHQLWKRST
jgi:uncharacterized protein (TIGR04255 family)